jgi:hypothetical protein
MLVKDLKGVTAMLREEKDSIAPDRELIRSLQYQKSEIKQELALRAMQSNGQAH